MKLSIIIPVYNVEPYLNKCLDSLINQDLKSEEYELIVINDGSPDNCKEIILEYQIRYSNIVFIDQVNQGVSVARNQGINVAKGIYVMFIDPDDYIEENSLGMLLNFAFKKAIDVLYLKQTTVTLSNSFVSELDFSKHVNKEYSGPEIYEITRSLLKIGDSSVALLINNKLLKQYSILYPNNVPLLEDGIFGGKILMVAKKCAFVNDSFYYRTIRPGSATHSKLASSIAAQNGYIIGANDISSFSKSITLGYEQEYLKNNIIAKYVITNIMSAISSKSYVNLLFTKRKLRENNFEKLKTKGLYINKKYIKIYNTSFWLFVLYFIIESRIKKILPKKK